MKLELDGEDAQLLLLALALTVIQRPGWDFMCRELAKKLGGSEGEKLFDDFKRFNTHNTPKCVGQMLEIVIAASNPNVDRIALAMNAKELISRIAPT